MAKPKVFISSTFYDLRHIRASLEGFIEGLGYDPILSERGKIPYDSEKPLDKSCYRDASRVDIFVLLIGGRYGSAASDENLKTTPEFYDHYESVTKTEFRAAIDNDIPVYILVDKSVYIEYETYKLNRENNDFKYKQVDSVNVYRMLDEIADLPRNKTLYTFERYTEIEAWLKEQWAGTFQDLLIRRKEYKEFSTLSQQVGELSAINKSLKNYMEEIIRHSKNIENPEEIISNENVKFEEEIRSIAFNSNLFTQFVKDDFNYDNNKIKEIIINAKSITDLAHKLASDPTSIDKPVDLLNSWIRDILMFPEINDLRKLLGLTPLKWDIDESNKESSIVQP